MHPAMNSIRIGATQALEQTGVFMQRRIQTSFVRIADQKHVASNLGTYGKNSFARGPYLLSRADVYNGGSRIIPIHSGSARGFSTKPRSAHLAGRMELAKKISEIGKAGGSSNQNRGFIAARLGLTEKAKKANDVHKPAEEKAPVKTDSGKGHIEDFAGVAMEDLEHMYFAS